MVTNVTSLTGNGLKDWLWQRVSAVYLAVYLGYIFWFLLAHPKVMYADIVRLLQCPGFKIASVLVLLMLLVHGWIGIWTVTTDYVKCTCMRLTMQILVALLLLAQLVWGSMILWGY